MGCLQRKRIHIPFDICTCVLRKNLDLTQINCEAVINFNIGVERYPRHACGGVKQLPLIGQARNRKTVFKTMAVDSYSQNKKIESCISEILDAEGLLQLETHL